MGEDGKTFMEVGEGIMDFQAIFDASEKGGVEWCFCQPKRSPFDNRKGAHFGHTFRTLTIEKGPI